MLREKHVCRLCYFLDYEVFLQPPKISAYNKITMDLLILNDLLIEF